MPKWTEESLQRALQDVANGKSINAAADKHGIPRSTLQAKVGGRSSVKEAHESQQKLSSVQERHLKNWVLIQADLGIPVTHQQVRDFAGKVAMRNGYEDGVGKNWLDGFLSRHPDIKTMRGKRIDTDRFNHASTELIKAFFMLLMMPAIRTIRPKNRYNVDEVGMMEGIGYNGLVLGSAEKKLVLKKQPGSRSWTSILECCSADGRMLTPVVIFKGATVQQQHFPGELEFLDDWSFTSSPKGWTNDKIALEWLRQIFIPQTKPDHPSEPRLLILDGHGSHMTLDFMFECYENNIFLLFLIPHTSHVCQPLDLSIFGPLKAAYRRLVSELSDAEDTPYSKAQFLINYYKARHAAMTEKNVIAGWKVTGLWPVNLAKVLMNPMVTKTPEQPKRPKTPPNTLKRPAECIFETPKSSMQVRNTLAEISSTIKVNKTVRLVFKKIGHQMDRQHVELEARDREIKQLRHRNEQLMPKKLKKVKPEGNALFAQVPAIKKAREEMAKILKPRATGIRVKKTKFEDLCNTFHINLH